MKSDIIELFKKYLPDYQELLKENVYNISGNISFEEFFLKFFPEALDNFLKEYTDEICAKQRESCANVYDDMNWQGDWRPLQFIDKISNAEQPEVEYRFSLKYSK